MTMSNACTSRTDSLLNILIAYTVNTCMFLVKIFVRPHAHDDSLKVYLRGNCSRSKPSKYQELTAAPVRSMPSLSLS